jgi:hypothetical protein
MRHGRTRRARFSASKLPQLRWPPVVTLIGGDTSVGLFFVASRNPRAGATDGRPTHGRRQRVGPGWWCSTVSELRNERTRPIKPALALDRAGAHSWCRERHHVCRARPVQRQPLRRARRAWDGPALRRRLIAACSASVSRGAWTKVCPRCPRGIPERDALRAHLRRGKLCALARRNAVRVVGDWIPLTAQLTWLHHLRSDADFARGRLASWNKLKYRVTQLHTKVSGCEQCQVPELSA